MSIWNALAFFPSGLLLGYILGSIIGNIGKKENAKRIEELEKEVKRLKASKE